MHMAEEHGQVQAGGRGNGSISVPVTVSPPQSDCHGHGTSPFGVLEECTPQCFFLLFH